MSAAYGKGSNPNGMSADLEKRQDSPIKKKGKTLHGEELEDEIERRDQQEHKRISDAKEREMEARVAKQALDKIKAKKAANRRKSKK
jgi:hypothetical protein